MYVKVSHTKDQRGKTSCTCSKWAIHTKLPEKKMLRNDKLEYFHVHGRIILKVKDEAVPGLRHEGTYERLTSRPGCSTPRTNPRHSLSRRLDGHQSMSGCFKKRKITLRIRTLDLPACSLVSLLATLS